MKITLLTADLTKALTIANRFVSHKGQLPILANILISASDAGITLSATNLETGVRITLPGKTHTPGEITTPARSFTEFVATVGESQIELEATESKFKVSSGKFKADFPTIAAAEFPVIPKIETQEQTTLSASLISLLATQVAYAAATDESRPVLTGIKILASDGVMTAIGTDGFRLSKKLLTDAKKAAMPNGVVIPSRTLVELSKVLSDASEESLAIVNLSENNQVVFVTSRVELFSRVLEGNFPDVEKIIPKSFTNEAILDKNEFVRGIRAAAIFARDSNNIIKLLVSDSKLEIKAASAGSGETVLELEAETSGSGEILFNYKYITDFLASVTAERILMQFNEPTNPVQFSSVGDNSYLHIIMPIRV